MSKRLTDSDKWGDKWFRRLKPEMKLLWCYMLDTCDNAGIWEIDLEAFQFMSGLAVSSEDFKTTFENRISFLEGDKVWIKKFVYFQCGILSEDCKAHKNVLESLKIHRVYNDYLMGIQPLQEKEKEKDKKEFSSRKGGAGGKPSLEHSHALMSVFDRARKHYPGTKNGLNAEWDNFCKKHGDQAVQVLPLLLPAIEAEIEHKTKLKAEKKFVPAWKHFQTWVNHACWTQELGETGDANGTNRPNNPTRSERLDADAAELLRDIQSEAEGYRAPDSTDAPVGRPAFPR